VQIGRRTVIKEGSIINAFKSVFIGDSVIVDRDVFFGGMQSDKSAIEVGNDCVILYRSYLNTTRKIFIGNNVGIGGYCLIFTHSAWQNVLNGNPYKFADVEIKDNAWLPWNVTVLPGVIIERDVTIGTGSTVTKSVLPYVFVAGVPAKVIRKKFIYAFPREQKYDSTGNHEILSRLCFKVSQVKAYPDRAGKKIWYYIQRLQVVIHTAFQEYSTK